MIEPLQPLGVDFLKFLAAFVVITPVFKRLNVSPILGFLLAGLLLRQINAISSPKELGELAELGVLFLLFEMGLELSSDRLRALRTYAFGLGTVQVSVTTAVFVAFAVPFGSSVGTWLLQNLAFADAQIAAITSWDEALVIAVALSLSSSAFVLQLLGDRGQLATRSGSATLGILLFQDLTTVPFLVLLPLIASSGTGDANASASAATLVQTFLPTAARSLGLLGGIILFGRLALRRIFAAVASTGSHDAFVAACLLTVCGTAVATDQAGFGQELGAFLAGVLLAESSFRPQVEAEIKPFKGVLLGLFFLCTGASVDVHVLITRFPTIALLTVGLISVKFAITSIAARLFGLSEGESVKVGLTLSQGGEFAFVLLALAQELEMLPGELNALLICVVVASMALTPYLADLGDNFEAREAQSKVEKEAESLKFELMDPGDAQAVLDQNGGVARSTIARKDSPIVILGFNEASQVVANMLSSPLTGNPARWVAFSFNPEAVREARGQGLPVLFGDGSNASVLGAATAAAPRAFVLSLRSHPQTMQALRNIRQAWPTVPAFVLCVDVERAGEAQRLGATATVVTRASAGVALGDVVLRALMDTSYVDLVFLEQEMQLMVKDAVAAKSRGSDSGTMSTNAGVMHGVGFASSESYGVGRDVGSERQRPTESVSGDEGDGGSGAVLATDTIDLVSGRPGGRGRNGATKTKSLVEAAAAQKDSNSLVNATVDLSRDEKHDGSMPSRQRKRDKPKQWPWARTAAKLKLIDVKNNPRQRPGSKVPPLGSVSGSGTFDQSLDGPEGPGTK
eukprot:jgi/Ulvmu1/12393/UM009_0039.1